MSKYATKAAFARAIEMAKLADIEIGGFDLWPDGRIRIITPKAADSESKPEDIFDKLEREGKL